MYTNAHNLARFATASAMYIYSVLKMSHGFWPTIHIERRLSHIFSSGAIGFIIDLRSRLRYRKQVNGRTKSLTTQFPVTLTRVHPIGWPDITSPSRMRHRWGCDLSASFAKPLRGELRTPQNSCCPCIPVLPYLIDGISLVSTCPAPPCAFHPASFPSSRIFLTSTFIRTRGLAAPGHHSFSDLPSAVCRTPSASMRTAFAVLAFTGAVLAQVDISNLPRCAYGCVTNLGGCNQLDITCICSDTELISGLACCVSKECDTEDQDSK